MSPSETELNNSATNATNVSNDAISRFRIYKNLTVVSLGSMIILGTDDALFTMQSTLNSKEGIGMLTSALQCLLSSLISLTLPRYAIYKIGSKAVMILSIISFIPYFAANYYPTWLTMVGSSFFIGPGISLVWSSICTYLNDLSGLYDDYCTLEAKETVLEHQKEPYIPINQDFSLEVEYKQLKKYPHNSIFTVSNKISNKSNTISQNSDSLNVKCKTSKYILHSKSSKNERVTSQLDSITFRFFGFHSMVYQTGYLWSNVMIYFTLQTESEHDLLADKSNCSCGANYCNLDADCLEDNFLQPTDLTRNILISVCIALTFAAAVFTFIFLEDFRPKIENVAFSMDHLLATFKQMRTKNLALLTPLTVYTGLLKGFYIGDYTKSYISCAWGIRSIGLVTVFGSVTMIVSSMMSGWMVKHVGRFKILIVSAIANLALIVILLVWKPNQDEYYMFFFSSGLYGALYGAFFTQLRAYYGVLFKEDAEAAFGALSLWNEMGTALSLFFSIYLCNYIKVYLLLLCSTLGILGYIIVLFKQR